MIRPLEPDVAGPAHSSADPPNGGRPVIGHERTSTKPAVLQTGATTPAASARTSVARRQRAGPTDLRTTTQGRTNPDSGTLGLRRQNHTCSGPTIELVKGTWYDPVVVADGDLTIGNVRVVGDGVDLLDADGAVIRQGG
jgi:hypothetical protein